MIGRETDALTTRGVVRRERGDGRERLDAPARRDFWYGHGFVLDAPPDERTLQALIAEGRRHFGPLGVERFIVQWEQPYSAALPVPATPPGCDVDRTVAMIYAGAPVAVDPRVRDVTGRQWEDAAVLARDEYPQWAGHITTRVADLRALVDAGWARLVGIVDAHGRLDAMAGLVRDERYARFMLPITRPNARGRGLFSACARTLIAWALADAARVIVIVVDPVDGPERLYRRLGFTPATRIDAVVVPSG